MTTDPDTLQDEIDATEDAYALLEIRLYKLAAKLRQLKEQQLTDRGHGEVRVK